jgi:hypothetical protein
MLRNVLLIMCLMLVTGCPPNPSGGGDGQGDNGNSNANSNSNDDDGGDNGGDDGDNGATTVTGEIIFFSGRLPPEWTIAEAEYAEIAEKLEGLTAIDQPEVFPRLGLPAYRIVNDGNLGGLPQQVVVQEGIVRIRSGEANSFFTDSHDLESALRTSSQAAGAYAELGLDDEAAAKRK